MELKEGQLAIFYNEYHAINRELDNALREVLLKFGYRWWASGCSRITGIRDLAFDKLREETVGDWDKEGAKLLAAATV